MWSAYEHYYELVEKVKKEIKLGRIMNLFNHLPLANIHLSPVVLVPKSEGGWRKITHLSSGINSFIDPDLCAVHCFICFIASNASFDGVLDMIAKLGQGALLAKMDIKSVFRLVRSTQVTLIC